VTGHRIQTVWARVGTAIAQRVATEHRETFTRGEQDGTRTDVATEDYATVMFATDQGASGSVVISQISAGRKNRLWFEIDGARAALAFDQEEPERLWVGDRSEVRLVVRDPGSLGEEAGRYTFLPGGHAQGYADCFDAFVADTYRAIRAGGPSDAPSGLPTFADGERAARITDAVLASARSGTQVEV
jgi:predicted dehydrogenase